ncbi:hypothetical protein BaRGS_00025200 [Batillaria attramentaria]|uniref:Uncharacterized protein n=1 Tax=Batillaria attramentaria TaxID=370345 RepID=A0ABD0K8V8_9CAEN
MVAMKLKEVSSENDLHTKIRRGLKPIRAGATIRRPIEKRMKEYEDPSTYNSSRTVFYAETENVKEAEDQLLRLCKENGHCPKNDQEASNMPGGAARAGFVYMII